MSSGVYHPPRYKPDVERYANIWAQIERICARHLCRLAPVDAITDLVHGADAVLSTHATISIRIRDYKYYRNPETRTQFTLRYFRYNNIPTEFQKICRAKENSYLFYGFYNPQKTRLAGYFILDLTLLGKILPTLEPIKTVTNPDGSSVFRVYSLFQIPKRAVIAASGGIRKCLR